MILSYSIHEITPYINWIYFFHAWGFQPRFAAIADIQGCDACRASWLSNFEEKDRGKASEAMQLLKEANRMLNLLDKDFQVKSIVRLCKANSDGDNLILDGITLPLLRQQTQKDNKPFLCLSDFVRPLTSGIPDTVGVFATSVSEEMEKLYENDSYKHLLVQTIADRLAEAATEKTHEYIRRTPDMAQENVQNIRPAVGYPSLPDQSINFILNDLLNMKEIGITLTENGAMHPHASVSGLLISHPQARYFAVGKIGEDQLADYAVRRNMPVGLMKKFLAGNIDAT